MRGTIPIRTRRRRNLGTSRLWIVLCWLLVSVFLCWFCFYIFALLVTASSCFVLSALSVLFCCPRFASCLVISLLLDFYISLYTCFILFVIYYGPCFFSTQILLMLGGPIVDSIIYGPMKGLLLALEILTTFVLNLLQYYLYSRESLNTRRPRYRPGPKLWILRSALSDLTRQI